MDPDLVRAAGLEADLEKRSPVEAAAHAPGCDRQLPGLRASGEALPVARVACVESLEAARVGRLAVHEREVGLLDRAFLKRALERLECRVVLGDDEAAGGLLVEAVDDARPEHAADAGQPRDVVEERVDERSSRVAGGGMDDETGGLVE